MKKKLKSVIHSLGQLYSNLSRFKISSIVNLDRRTKPMSDAQTFKSNQKSKQSNQLFFIWSKCKNHNYFIIFKIQMVKKNHKCWKRKNQKFKIKHPSFLLVNFGKIVQRFKWNLFLQLSIFDWLNLKTTNETKQWCTNFHFWEKFSNNFQIVPCNKQISILARFHYSEIPKSFNDSKSCGNVFW